MTKNAKPELEETVTLSESTLNKLVENIFNAGLLCGRAEARCEIYRQEPVWNSDGIDYSDGARGSDDPTCPF